jgi:CRP/FNR family cyclic AMP-dependent transcriptional regulator
LSSFAQQLLQSLEFSNSRVLASLCELNLTSYEKGEVIFKKGASVQTWACVISGYVAASANLDKGKHLPIRIYGGNAWIGEQALLSNQPCLLDYICLTQVEVIGMSKKCFDSAFLEEANFVRLLTRLVTGQLNQESEMRVLMRMNSPAMLIVMGLAQFAESVGPKITLEWPNQENQTLDIPIGQHTIAEVCGLSRTLFSELLQHLARAGWLTVRYGGIELKHVATWCTFARQQRRNACIPIKSTIHDVLADMALAQADVGPYRYPNLINVRNTTTRR